MSAAVSDVPYSDAWERAERAAYSKRRRQRRLAFSWAVLHVVGRRRRRALQLLESTVTRLEQLRARAEAELAEVRRLVGIEEMAAELARRYQP